MSKYLFYQDEEHYQWVNVLNCPDTYTIQGVEYLRWKDLKNFFYYPHKNVSEVLENVRKHIQHHNGNGLVETPVSYDTWNERMKDVTTNKFMTIDNKSIDELTEKLGGYDSKGDFHLGQHKDEGKTRLDLVPPDFIVDLADHMTYNLKKYPERNWEAGINYSKIYGSVLRHIFAWIKGERYTQDTNKSHLISAVCNLLFLYEYEKRNMTKFDDRSIINGNISN